MLDREQLAADILCSMICGLTCEPGMLDDEEDTKAIITSPRRAVLLADLLIAELERPSRCFA